MKHKWMKPTRKMHKHIVETDHGNYEVGYPIVYFCKYDSAGNVEAFGYIDEIYNKLGGNVVLLEGFDSGIKNVYKVTPYYWKTCRFYSSLYDLIQNAA